tara:strand:+ start:254 stop:481 length:228 start_codon:yes stop_codon:yes gene_type:complete
MRYSVPRHRGAWPGVLLTVFLVIGITLGALWRSEKLIMAALGATRAKVAKTEGPSCADRDFLNLVIEEEVSNDHY